MSTEKKPLLIAAGILPICQPTKRMCFLWRSPVLEYGNCWGLPGGIVADVNESPKDAAKREMKEETGYDGDVQIVSSYIYQSNRLTYYNFIGAVREEFSYMPHPDHAWENLRLEWMEWGTMCARLSANIKDFHPGVVEFFWHKQEQIKAVLGI